MSPLILCALNTLKTSENAVKYCFFLLLLALQTEGYGAGWSFCGRLLITFAPRALGRMCFQSAMPRGETDTPRNGLWEERRQAA